MQVVRYTALLGGVFYGIVHRRSLQKAHDAEVKHHAIHEREHLIEEAKEAWKKKQQSSKDGGEYIPSMLFRRTAVKLPSLSSVPQITRSTCTHRFFHVPCP